MLVAVERRLRELEALRRAQQRPHPVPPPTNRREDLTNARNKFVQINADIVPSDEELRTTKPIVATASVAPNQTISPARPVPSIAKTQAIAPTAVISPTQAIAPTDVISPTEAAKPSDVLLQMRRMRIMLAEGGGGALAQEPDAAGVVVGSAITTVPEPQTPLPRHRHEHEKMSLMQQVAKLQKA